MLNYIEYFCLRKGPLPLEATDLVTIIVREGESVEHAIKRFKKAVAKDGILKKYREKEYYKSKGQKRAEAKHRAERRALRYKQQ